MIFEPWLPTSAQDARQSRTFSHRPVEELFTMAYRQVSTHLSIRMVLRLKLKQRE